MGGEFEGGERAVRGEGEVTPAGEARSSYGNAFGSGMEPYSTMDNCKLSP